MKNNGSFGAIKYVKTQITTFYIHVHSIIPTVNTIDTKTEH
jgi:hypothetical protein